MGDNIEGTATSGTTTTLVDSGELVNWADDVLIGHFVYIYAGTGIGQERRITDSAQSTGTLTVPTWTAPSTDSTYEIHNQWRVADYNAAINQAIADLWGDTRAMVTLVSNVSLTMTDAGASTDYYYALPTGFRSIHRGAILVEGPTADIYDDPPLLYGRDWTFEKKTAATSSADAVWNIVISRYSSHAPIASRQLRIIGAGSQAELSTDTTTLANHLLTFVLHRAAYYLLSPMTGTGTPDAQANARRADRHYAESESARTRFDYSVPPGTKQVPE